MNNVRKDYDNNNTSSCKNGSPYFLFQILGIVTEKREQQKDGFPQYPDPLMQIMNDNDYVEIKRDEDVRLGISLFDHAEITKDFLEATQKNGYKFDRIYNDIITCSQPENSHYKLDSTQETPLAYIKTTICFEDIKYVPALESCLQNIRGSRK